jgi:hypothetical protein
MRWLSKKLQDEDGFWVIVLAVVGAVAIIVYVVHRI